MLRKLRWQLSLLYLLAAALLILLIGGGVYGLLTYYFKSATDLALQVKVAQEYSRLGLAVPLDLQAVDLAWQTQRKSPTPTLSPIRREEDDEGSEEDTPKYSNSDEESFDSELAPIFILLIDSQGQVIVNPNAYSSSIQPDPQAVAAALANGSDFRTVRQADGSRRRLFTYRITAQDEVALLQVGRSLKDQDRLLEQFLAGLLVLSGLSVLAVGVASWWLAGRSLDPGSKGLGPPADFCGQRQPRAAHTTHFAARQRRGGPPRAGPRR